MTLRITTSLVAGLGIAALGLVSTACGSAIPTAQPVPASSVDNGYTQPPPSNAKSTPSTSPVLDAKFGQTYVVTSTAYNSQSSSFAPFTVNLDTGGAGRVDIAQ